MRYAIVDPAPQQVLAKAHQLTGPGVSHVRIGSTLFVYSTNKTWAATAESLGIDRSTAGSVKEQQLRLVQQKGRSFQQEHPDVEVLLDKGRFLVVARPAGGARLTGDETHYRVLPMPEDEVLVAIRHRTRARADATVAPVVAGVDKARFESHLADLVGHHTRLSTSTQYATAAQWCRDQLIALGLDAQLVTVDLPNGTTSNVVARKPGTDAMSTRKELVLCAHLDSVNHAGGPTARAPGADDNASGSAGLLTLAAALASHHFRDDLTFVLFGGEEQGLFGSKEYVAGLSASARERIRAVINMDMVGTVNSEPQTVLLEGAPLSQELIDALADAADRYTDLQVETSLHPFASDHVPFIEQQIQAVLTIEGGDSANSAIHTAADTLDRVTPEYAEQILRMNAATAASLAGLQAPVAQPCGCVGDDGTGRGAEESHSAELTRHYQALFSQYRRLAAADCLSPSERATLQSTYDAYLNVMGLTP